MGKEPKPREEEMPAAGPHAKPELIDEEKTPGSGVVPDGDDETTDAPTG